MTTTSESSPAAPASGDLLLLFARFLDLSRGCESMPDLDRRIEADDLSPEQRTAMRSHLIARYG